MFYLPILKQVMLCKNHNDVLFGFEVGNEPDLYSKDSIRDTSYKLKDYEKEFRHYYDTIRKYQPTAVFTGPGCASNYTEWTEPFRRDMDTLKSFSMLTQHYYGGDKNAVTVDEQIDSLLSKEKLRHVAKEVELIGQMRRQYPFSNE